MILYYILVPFAWLLWHIGFRIHVEGRENLKKVQTKGCILAPTHVSAIDPVFIVVTRWGRRMIVFAKKELFEINALLTWFFRCCGAVCVRGTKDEMATIEQTVEKCRNGETLLIFPEGTREKDGKLRPPKSRRLRDRLRRHGHFLSVRHRPWYKASQRRRSVFHSRADICSLQPFSTSFSQTLSSKETLCSDVSSKLF